MFKALWIILVLVIFLPFTATAQVTADTYSGCAGTTPSRILQANPANYLDFVDALQPGDLLQLTGGTYTEDLPLHNVNGTAGNCIIVEGPTSGTPALFVNTHDCCNTVSLENSSYLIIRNLELDGRQGEADGVKAEGHADWTHHITIENLYIHDYDGDQLIVGISTKIPSWNWVIRGNRIESSGTGIYLGDSDGEDEFVNGLIENNVIINSTGYNMQIKRQDERNLDLADGSMPANGRTIIRHNVFTKASDSATGDDGRPNLLVGHWPLDGPGSNDDYVIYGNFFFENEDGFEALFQGTGNVIFYDNILYNSHGPGVAIFAHEGGNPQRVSIFQNTILAQSEGIGISDVDSSFQQIVRGNAVFAAEPINGGQQSNNVTDSFTNAAAYLNNPNGQLSGTNRMDLFPNASGKLSGSATDLSPIASYPDAARDFNGLPQDGIFRGAYTGQGANPGWQLAIEKKESTGKNYNGIWWEQGKTGQGITLLHEGNIVSGVWYLYDEIGNGLFITFTGQLNSTTLTAEVFEFTGPPLGTLWNSSQVNSTSIGNVTINFLSENNATFAYTVNNISGILELTPFVISGNPGSVTDADVWWDPGRSGQGVTIQQEGNILSGVWYLYDENGTGMWVTFVGEQNNSSFTSSLFKFTGSALGTPWNNAQVVSTSVGTVTLDFISPDSMNFVYSVNGVNGSLNLTPFHIFQ